MDNNIYVLNPENGEEIKRFRIGHYGPAIGPVIYNNMIFQETRDGDLYCLDMEGNEIWRFHTSEIIGVPIIYKNRIYIGSGDGNFYCLNMDGKEVWRFKTSGYTWYSTVHEDRVYVGSTDCHLYCLDLNGNELWRFTTSTLQPCSIPPAYEAWETEIKIESKDYLKEEKKGQVWNNPDNKFG